VQQPDRIGIPRPLRSARHRSSEEGHMMPGGKRFYMYTTSAGDLAGPSRETSRRPGVHSVSPDRERPPSRCDIDRKPDTRRNVTSGKTSPSPGWTGDMLNAREQEVLYWTSQGKTSWEIAMILGRSPSTVNFYVRSAVAKLGATNKCQASVMAAERGLLADGVAAPGNGTASMRG
jgi:DNA-binding CsgD family transcriptional regulator